MKKRVYLELRIETSVRVEVVRLVKVRAYKRVRFDKVSLSYGIKGAIVSPMTGFVPLWHSTLFPRFFYNKTKRPFAKYFADWGILHKFAVCFMVVELQK
ncbi:MAG TPA: hypothetical protein DDX40_01960, partial [Rikenellaceae bacterium]|nr:hypothetical protein [Rikenellaceae bacterium]